MYKFLPFWTFADSVAFHSTGLVFNLVSVAQLTSFTTTTTFLAVVVSKATYTGLTLAVFGNSFSSWTSCAFNAATCCAVVLLVIVTVMMLCLQKRKHQVIHCGCRDLYRACASLWQGSLSLK